MPGDLLRKYKDGDKKISYRLLNELIDMLAEWKKTRLATSGPAKNFVRSPWQVTLRNDSGAGVSQFSILGVGDPLWGPGDNLQSFKYETVFKGEKPKMLPTVASATNMLGHHGRFAICIDPIPKDGIGCGIIGGGCPVQLD